MRIGILLFQFVKQIFWLHAKHWAIIWRKQVAIIEIVCLVFSQFLSRFSMNLLIIFQNTIIVIHFPLMSQLCWVNVSSTEVLSTWVLQSWCLLNAVHFALENKSTNLIFLFYSYISIYSISTYSLYILCFILCSWRL